MYSVVFWCVSSFFLACCSPVHMLAALAINSAHAIQLRCAAELTICAKKTARAVELTWI